MLIGCLFMPDPSKVLPVAESLAALGAAITLQTVRALSGFLAFDHAIVARQFGPCFLRAFASKMTVGVETLPLEQSRG